MMKMSHLVLSDDVSDLLLPPEVPLGDGLGEGRADDELEVVRDRGARPEGAVADANDDFSSEDTKVERCDENLVRGETLSTVSECNCKSMALDIIAEKHSGPC